MKNLFQTTMFIAGNDAREAAIPRVEKFVPDDVFIAGNVVRDEQPYHAFEKFVPDDVSIAGNDARDEQPYHADENLFQTTCLSPGTPEMST